MTANPSYFHQVGREPLQALTIGQLLEQAAAKYAEKPVVISRHQKKKLTFLELLKESDILAAGLLKLGLQKGDRLGLWAPNLIEWLITMMACARLGLVLVALNPFYQALEMEYCIKKVNMKAVLCAHKHKEQDYYEILKKIAPELNECQPGKLVSRNVPSLEVVVVITKEDLKGVYKYEEVLDMSDLVDIESVKSQQNLIQMDEICNIQFTSGTTGQPKAALLSHFASVNNSNQIGRENEFNQKYQKICLQVPFFHVFGSLGILLSLHNGATLVLPSASYSPERSLDAIAQESCTCIFGTPTMFVDLINCQMRRKENINPEIVICGGAPISPFLTKQIQDVLGAKTTRMIYGLTETTGACFESLPGEDKVLALTTVGCLKDHLEAKVVDENGNIVPIGTAGELCIRGYSTILGYWGDEAKTKELIANDKWLRTGDQFVLMENGYGRIVGRYKEMINRGGENIFPKEIEDVLNTHPDIVEVQVIGLPHGRLGEEVCVCIRAKEGAKVTLEAVAEHCKGKLARFKIPSQIRIVDQFPKTASGKIQKFKLVQQFKNDGY